MLGNKIVGYFTLLVEIHLKKKIINGKNIAIFKGGAIYIKSSAQFTLENYTFNNNFEDDHVEQYTMI